MYPIPGHLAMSIAGSRLTKIPYGPAIVATFAVDVMDKVCADTLMIAPYGRCWFHTLVSVAVCSWLIGSWKGRTWGYSWMMGHLLHLIGDIGFVPWFYPIIPYHWPESQNMVAVSMQGVKETLWGMHYSEAVRQVFKGKLLLLEMVLLISALILLHRRGERSKPFFALALAGFCFFLGFRLMYAFPSFLDTISHLLGDWIRV